MLRRDLVKKMGDYAKEQGCKGTIAEASAYLDALKDIVISAMNEREEVYIGGFVRFYVEEVPERKARNPRTGEGVIIPARDRVKIKILGDLKNSVE